MNKNTVQCDLCGQFITTNNYPKHLRRHEEHPETFKTVYKVDHDDLFCKFCGKECKSTKSLTQHEIRCNQNPERIMTEHNFKSFSQKGHVAWNKGLTKETDERVRQGAETFHQRALAGHYGDRFSINNPSKRDDVKKKISETCLERSRNGQWHTSLAKNLHILYNDEDLHGSWELKYAQYLDSNNIAWVRCKERFPYIFETSVHYYTPDFYLPDTDTYVEIKGYQVDKDIEKWKQFPSDKKLIVLHFEDLKQLGIEV